MATLARINVVIGAEDKTGAAIKSAGDRLQAFGKKAVKIGGWMTTRFTLPLVGVGAAAVNLASDLNESLSKTEVVFEKNANAVLKWSKRSATSFGLTRQEALENASTFGNLFRGMGLGTKEAASMSMQFTELAADMASINNVDIPQVLEDIQSGLVGQALPLRKYGVLLSEAAVQQRALEMTGKKTAKQLTEQEKVLARAALIMSQTTLAQGDFARTSSGLANQLRILRAVALSALAEWGLLLLPITIKIVGALIRLADWIANLNTRWKSLILVVLGVIAVLGPLTIVAGHVALALSALIPVIRATRLAFWRAIPAVRAFWSALLGPIGLILLLIAAFAIAYKFNLFGIRDLTNRVVSAVVRAFKRFIAILRGRQGLHDAIADLPKPIQKLAILLRRLVALPGRFFRTWRRQGALAAFERLAKDIEKIGRTIRNFLKLTGFRRAGDQVAATFRALANAIRDVVSIFDHLVHGRFRKAILAFFDLNRHVKEIFISSWRIIPALLADLVRRIDWAALARAGVDMLRSLIEGAEAFARETLIPWLSDLLREAPDWIGETARLLIDRGRQLLSGLWEGVNEVWTGTVRPFLLRLWERVLEAVPGASETLTALVETGKSILTAIWNGIKSIWNDEVKPFFTGIVSRVTGAMPSLMDLSTSLINAGKSILTAVWNGIKSVWNDVIRPFFTGIVSRVAGAMPALMDLSTSLINAGKSILTAIWNGIKSIWNDVIKPFFTGIVGKILGALPALLNLNPELVYVGEKIMEGIWNGMKWFWDNTIGKFFEGLAKAVKSAIGFFDSVPEKISSAISALNDLISTLETVLSLASSVWGKLEDIGRWIGRKIGVGGGGDTTETVKLDMQVADFKGESALEAIRGWVDDVLEEFGRVSHWLVPVPVGGQGGAATMPSMTPPAFLGEATLEAIRQFRTQVGQIFRKIRLDVLTELLALRVQAILTTRGLGSGVLTELTTLKKNVWRLLGNLAIDVDIQFGVARKNAKNRVFWLARDVENELILLRSTGNSLANQIAAKITTPFGSMSRTLTQGEGAFRVLRLDISASLQETAKTAGEKAAGVRNAIIDAFRGIFGRGWTIGWSLGAGIAAGLAAWLIPLAALAASIVTAAVAAAKFAAGIKSPSRVMEHLGEQLMAGLALGIEQGGERVIDALGRTVGRTSLVPQPMAAAAGHGFINYGTIHVEANDPAEFYSQLSAWEAAAARR